MISYKIRKDKYNGIIGTYIYRWSFDNILCITDNLAIFTITQELYETLLAETEDTTKEVFDTMLEKIKKDLNI